MTAVLVFLGIVVAGAAGFVWSEARALAVRARRLASYVPGPAGAAVVHASAPARLLATRFLAGTGPARRRIDVPIPALPVGLDADLRVTDEGVVVATSSLLPHPRIIDLSLLEEAAGARAERMRTLLALTLDVDGGPLELVFSIEGTRVTAERVRRETHVRGGRVQAELAAVLARKAAGGTP